MLAPLALLRASRILKLAAPAGVLEVPWYRDWSRLHCPTCQPLTQLHAALPRAPTLPRHPLSSLPLCAPCLASTQLPGGSFSGYDAYVALMQRCWAEDPADRPTFEQASCGTTCR